MRHIFLDFDYTTSWIAPVLIARMHTYADRQNLAPWWDDAYQDAVASGFCLEALAEALQVHSGKTFDVAELVRGLDHALFDDLPDTVYPDVEPAIIAWRKEGHEVRLLTRGNVAWQKRKIQATRLPGLLNEDEMLSVEQEHKAQVMASLAESGDTVVLLDDSVRELDKAATWQWPHGVTCETYRVDRRLYVPEHERSHVKWQELETLSMQESAHVHKLVRNLPLSAI